MHRTAAVHVVLALVLALSAMSWSADAEDQAIETQLDIPRGGEACAVGKRLMQQKYPEMFTGMMLATPGQENYDVTYYDLDLNVQTSLPRKITGILTMKAKVVSPTLAQAVLDLRLNLAITAVTSGGVPATFSRAGNVLTVNLDHTYTAGQIFTVRVDYNGTPSGGSFSFTSHSPSLLIWSQSEPYGARNWWPCKDHPEDKPDSMDIHFNLPDTHTCASNGKLLSTTVPSAGRKRWNFRTNYPIATYLVSIAAFPYTVYSDWYHYTPTDSMEIKFHVYPEDYPDVVPTNALVKDMLEVYAGLFGEYPFVNEKYGHAAYDWGGAMEHQTCTSMSGGGVNLDEYIVAHELTHQWWGDLVTCHTFNHIWVNEGFATYGEALWAEAAYGQAAYESQMGGAAYYGPGTVYVEDPATQDIFDSGLSYNKGSWVLHMLRHVLGDGVFFDCLAAYYSAAGTAYASATTEEFRDICESVSGRDLDRFFNQWIYGEYYPIYEFDWSAAPAAPASGYNLTLDINQVQTWQMFQMPIDVTVSFASGETTLVVQDSLAHQVFNLNVAQQPTRVQLDRNNWILRLVNEPLPVPTFDRGILVVNGVDWETYTPEIESAYQDSVFWGNHDIAFWDCFPAPSGGYPAILPAPLGHGTVPPDTLKQFSAVVWVGNNFNGDVLNWNNTPIKGYLDAGGNVLLISRLGRDFVNLPLQNYLGLTWREGSSETLGNCIASFPGLVNISFTGTQSLCAVFDTTLTQPESRILFKETSSFGVPRGSGVWRAPAGGGLYREDGGQFAFLSGRGYRMNHNQLRQNVQYILDSLFVEPFSPATSVTGTAGTVRWSLGDARPNPFNPKTTIRFNVAQETEVSLRIFDVAGREVATLVNGRVAAGAHSVTWDGRGANGRPAASGVYFYRLEAPGFTDTRKMVMMK